MRKIVTKLSVLCKSCSLLIWPFYGLLQQYEIKMSQNWNLCQFCAQVSQNVLLADLIRFTAYYNCLSKNVTKLMSRRVLCTGITNSVPSWFDRSRAFYNYIKKNVTKLISTRVLWTSITNRVLSRFDRFMSYLNCMSKIITKLISLWVLCTSITDRVLSWFDRCTAN